MRQIARVASFLMVDASKRMGDVATSARSTNGYLRTNGRAKLLAVDPVESPKKADAAHAHLARKQSAPHTAHVSKLKRLPPSFQPLSSPFLKRFLKFDVTKTQDTSVGQLAFQNQS